MNLKFVALFLGIFLFLPFCSAAHFIVGVANDALDGTPANDHEVVLWNPSVGMSDNLTDIIGPNGNSGADNIYLIDCELLSTSCEIGDEIRIKIFDSGDGYVSENVSVTITGAGFDVAPNITMNSPPSILSIVVDDSLTTPENEIDLLAGTTREVFCDVVVEELDGNLLQNISAEFFDSVLSFYGDINDNNTHYTNSSCFVNSSYGTENQSKITCGFDVLYYANSQIWECFFRVEDNLSSFSNDSDTSFINELLSIEVNSFLDFGSLVPNSVSDEFIMNVSNVGNVEINLSLSGYAKYVGDGNAMNCSNGENISIDYKKYNLTDSTPGNLGLSEFESTYNNLTSSPVIRDFGLSSRQNEEINEAVNSTYWRVYVPSNIFGTCEGNIVFGAVVGGGV